MTDGLLVGTDKGFQKALGDLSTETVFVDEVAEEASA